MSASAKPKRTVGRDLKSERMELRLAPAAKRLIQRAMSVTGLAAGDLAYEGARRVLEEHERMVLTGADREVFLNAIRHPPAPSRRLIQAFRRHRAMLG